MYVVVDMAEETAYVCTDARWVSDITDYPMTTIHWWFAYGKTYYEADDYIIVKDAERIKSRRHSTNL